MTPSLFFFLISHYKLLLPELLKTGLCYLVYQSTRLLHSKINMNPAELMLMEHEQQVLQVDFLAYGLVPRYSGGVEY